MTTTTATTAARVTAGQTVAWTRTLTGELGHGTVLRLQRHGEHTQAVIDTPAGPLGARINVDHLTATLAEALEAAHIARHRATMTHVEDPTTATPATWAATAYAEAAAWCDAAAGFAAATVHALSPAHDDRHAAQVHTAAAVSAATAAARAAAGAYKEATTAWLTASMPAIGDLEHQRAMLTGKTAGHAAHAADSARRLSLAALAVLPTATP